MFPWIEKFDGTNDHPMSGVAGAKAVLADLPADDPLKALAEITDWLISVKESASFRPERRTSIVMLLDETAQPFHTKLLQEYLDAPHLQDFHGMHIWKGIHAHMKAQAEAYGACALECRQTDKFSQDFKELIPVIYVRLIRSIAEQLKLELMRYIEVEQSVWSRLYGAYQLAEANQMTGTMVYAYAGHPIHTSPQRELLRALALYDSSPGTLAPDQIEVAYRIAARMVSFFDMKEHPASDCPNYIDLAAPAAPRRVDDKLHPVPSMRFFGTQRAVPKVEEITHQNESGILEKEKRFGNEFSPDGKLTVLKHLQRYWASEQPHRHEERMGINVSVDVVHGYKTIGHLVTRIEPGQLQNISGEDAAKLKELLSIDFTGDKIDYTTETWPVLDASNSGLGVIMPTTAGTWGKIGALVGLKTKPDNPWWIGMVRRVKTDAQDKVHVGIEILTKKPVAVWLRILGKGAEKVSNWETSSGSFEYDYLHVILLPDSHNSYLHATLLMESGCYVAGQVYELMMGEKNHTIRFAGLLAEGADYEQVSIEWTDLATG